MLGMQFTAESPRWLCKVGRLVDAESVIYNLWGETDVENSMKEIMYVTGNIDDPTTWVDLLVEPHRTVAFIGGSLFILQQLSGINGVLYFSSLTFSDVGIRSGSLASLYVGITNFAGALIALYLMDKQGRKKLLVGSYLGMAFSMFIVALAIVSPVKEDLSHTLSVVGSLTYIFSFAIGAGPATGLVIPELSSAQMRSKIMAFSFSIHWICNFLVGLFFLDLVEKFGVASVYGVFGAVSICSAIFATFFVVETKGRTLEEIEISLASDVQRKGR